MSLATRITSALSTVVPSGQVTTLLKDVREEEAQLQSSLSSERDRALDPMSDADTVADARRKIQDIEFNTQRLAEATKRLDGRFTELSNAEKAADASARQAALEARQKAVRDQFNTEYPIMAQRIASLAKEMTAAGLERELPRIHLSDGASDTTGMAFNHRRFWPKPEQGYEHPISRGDGGHGGRLMIVHDKQEKAA